MCDFQSTEDNVKALTTLSGSLTELQLWPTDGLGFLPQFSNLTDILLNVNDEDTGVWLVSADAFLAAFGCPSLARLNMSAPLTSKHMASLLSRLPLLQELTLRDMSELESLSFLSECAAAQRILTSFCVSACRHPKLHSKELFHLHSLKALVGLTILQSFVEPLDEFGRALFTPPTRFFPLLEHFAYQP